MKVTPHVAQQYKPSLFPSTGAPLSMWAMLSVTRNGSGSKEHRLDEQPLAILKKVKLRGLEKVRWLQTLVDIASDSMITLITGANPW